MNLFQVIRQKYINNVNLNDSKFIYGRNEQARILDSMPEPKDNIERSYNQFRCQFLIHSMNPVFLQAGALLLLFYKRWATPQKTGLIEQKELVCMLDGIGKSRIPQSLTKKYGSIGYCSDVEHYVLNREDYRWFINNIRRRYPFEFFFQLKIFLRMTQYRYLIDAYRPEAIATHSEYFCGSSAMTEFCHARGIRHINLMHGDKVWGIRDSFFRFDECYVWHEHYKKMFLSLKAFPGQFIVELPPEFHPGKIEVEEGDKADYCYYFQIESHEEIDRILACLAVLKNRGSRVRARLHPRWSDAEYINRKAQDRNIEIEAPGIDINYSILASGHAISKFSTVLLQSYFLGIPVIIDDCSDVHKYNKIKEYDYIMLSLEHTLLSQELGDDFGLIKEEDWHENRTA